MNQQEILIKAIEKAMAGGWNATGWWKNVFVHYEWQDHLSEWSSKTDNVHVNALIFNHDFAKAIAGGDWTKFLCDLVVEPNPIKELENWL